MKTLFILLALLADIPSGYYDSYCSKETIDSVYTASLAETSEEYGADAEAAAWYYMADWAYNVSLMDLSEHCIDVALTSDISDQVLRADCLSMASLVSRIRGDLAGAIEYAEECLLIDRESGNQENISSSLNNIAGLYLMHGDARTAATYIDEAIAIEAKAGRSAYLAIRYGVASEIYAELGDLSKALEYADMALQIDSLDNRTEKIAVRRSQKAAVLMDMERFDDAERELKLALPVFISQNSLNSLAITYAQLGEIAAWKGNVAEADAAFTESIKVSQSIRHIYMESRASKGMYRLYKDLSPAKALSYLERYVELEDQIHSEKAEEMMQAFNVRYRTLEKENTIRLQEQDIRARNLILACLVILLILAVVVAVLKNKAAKAMEQKNAVLVKANLDKDRLISLSKHNIPEEVKQEIASIVSDVETMPAINLTKREIQIAELCSQGMLNKEIAAELGISQRTVETHKNNLFRKLGINNTVELMRYMQKIQK
jgi:DNA-binding CsgD family transcriptional regulator/tetratricopeptide (TPR) repeat protein